MDETRGHFMRCQRCPESMIMTIKGVKFIAVLKDNRLVALSLEDWNAKRFVRVDKLEFPGQGAVQGWLKGSARAVQLIRQVFKNQDGSTGILHLVCSDITCDYDTINTNYKKRWQVEVFHKSLKSNAAMAKSPTQTLRTQSNHVFMVIVATFKLACLMHQGQAQPLCPSTQTPHQRHPQRLPPACRISRRPA